MRSIELLRRAPARDPMSNSRAPHLPTQKTATLQGIKFLNAGEFYAPLSAK